MTDIFDAIDEWYRYPEPPEHIKLMGHRIEHLMGTAIRCTGVPLKEIAVPSAVYQEFVAYVRRVEEWQIRTNGSTPPLGGRDIFFRGQWGDVLIKDAGDTGGVPIL